MTVGERLPTPRAGFEPATTPRILAAPEREHPYAHSARVHSEAFSDGEGRASYADHADEQHAWGWKRALDIAGVGDPMPYGAPSEGDPTGDERDCPCSSGQLPVEECCGEPRGDGSGAAHMRPKTDEEDIAAAIRREVEHAARTVRSWPESMQRQAGRR